MSGGKEFWSGRLSESTQLKRTSSGLTKTEDSATDGERTPTRNVQTFHYIATDKDDQSDSEHSNKSPPVPGWRSLTTPMSTQQPTFHKISTDKDEKSSENEDSGYEDASYAYGTANDKRDTMDATQEAHELFEEEELDASHELFEEEELDASQELFEEEELTSLDASHAWTCSFRRHTHAGITCPLSVQKEERYRKEESEDSDDTDEDYVPYTGRLKGVPSSWINATWVVTASSLGHRRRFPKGSFTRRRSSNPAPGTRFSSRRLQEMELEAEQLHEDLAEKNRLLEEMTRERAEFRKRVAKTTIEKDMELFDARQEADTLKMRLEAALKEKEKWRKIAVQKETDAEMTPFETPRSEVSAMNYGTMVRGEQEIAFLVEAMDAEKGMREEAEAELHRLIERVKVLEMDLAELGDLQKTDSSKDAPKNACTGRRLSEDLLLDKELMSLSEESDLLTTNLGKQKEAVRLLHMELEQGEEKKKKLEEKMKNQEKNAHEFEEERMRKKEKEPHSGGILELNDILKIMGNDDNGSETHNHESSRKEVINLLSQILGLCICTFLSIVSKCIFFIWPFSFVKRTVRARVCTLPTGDKVRIFRTHRLKPKTSLFGFIVY